MKKNKKFRENLLNHDLEVFTLVIELNRFLYFFEINSL